MSYIIQIEGCTNAGKSLFWDEYTKALLGSSAKMIQKFASEYFKNDPQRFPELWAGRYAGEDLKILFFNAGVCEPGEARELLDFIYRVQRNREPLPRERGDILMINQFEEMASSPIGFDLKIDLMNTQRYIPEGQDIPEMSRALWVTAQGEMANHPPMKNFLTL